MGDCVFCGKSAGLFKGRHAECAAADEQAKAAETIRLAQATEQREKEEQHRKDALELLSKAAHVALRSGGDLIALEHQFLDAIIANQLTHADMTTMLVSVYAASVDSFLEDGLLDDTEEQYLTAFQSRFALSQDRLDANGAFTRVAKASVLKSIMSGVLPPYKAFNQDSPVNFQKNEQPVWAFADCQYMEDVVRKQFVGGSQGMSFRIMSGVYYRIGGFKGESVSSIQRKNLGSGMLIVTNQNLYFVGLGKTTRIPYAKIVSFSPFSDGFGIVRDAATAKPQFFLTADGWFAFNLVTNLAKL